MTLPFKLSFLLLFFVCTNGIGQEVSSSKYSLVGVWNISDYAHAAKTLSTVHFKEDGSFEELKQGAEEYGKDTLVADEKGTWELNNDTLTVSVTSELTGKTRYTFPVAQVSTFFIEQKKEGLFMYPLTDSFHVNMKKKTLMLKRKQ